MVFIRGIEFSWNNIGRVVKGDFVFGMLWFIGV